MQKEHSGDILRRSIYCSMLSRGEQNAVLWVDVKDLSTVGAILIKVRMYFHFYLFLTLNMLFCVTNLTQFPKRG